MEKWAKYRMYSYISSELPQLLRREAPGLDMGRLSVMGHSMGGHGAAPCRRIGDSTQHICV